MEEGRISAQSVSQPSDVSGSGSDSSSEEEDKFKFVESEIFDDENDDPILIHGGMKII